MLRLNTFGGLALLNDGAAHAGPASQRRRLAVLALVAAAGPRGISREKLCRILWPDSEAQAARHALDQSLHAIRRSVGSDEIFQGTSALRLNGEFVSSDVADFDEAVARGAHERAARAYQGAFLDGFHVPGADEFEAWAEAERARRAREYASALEALASDAVARRDQLAAVHWWRRLASAEPLSARAALGLVEALAAVGDRSGALHFALVHKTLTEEQLGARCDAAVDAWIARLRAGDALPSANGRATGQPAAPPRAHGEPADDETARVARLKSALGDRYALGERAAERAMLLTYRARDRRDTRAVEVNVLNAPLVPMGRGGDVLRVLERIAALRDPRIVPVLECGATGDFVFFVTEPTEGPSLREHLVRRRPLPLGEALRIGSDVAGALAYAHARGVRHGDLRPKHVVLTPAGDVVASLGLLEALNTAAAGDNAGTTAITVGAPAYQSPEQIAGEVVADEPSDVYSLGCMLFEMLAGEPPFGTASSYLVLRRKLTEAAPSVRTVRESVPPALDELLSGCLARSPADRIQSAATVTEALSKLREGAGV